MGIERIVPMSPPYPDGAVRLVQNHETSHTALPKPEYDIFLKTPTTGDILPYVAAAVGKGSATILSPHLLPFDGHPRPVEVLGVRHISMEQIGQLRPEILPLRLNNLRSTQMDALMLTQVGEEDLIFEPGASHVQQALACLTLARHVRTMGAAIDIFATHGTSGFSAVHFGRAPSAQTDQTTTTRAFGLAAGG